MLRHAWIGRIVRCQCDPEVSMKSMVSHHFVVMSHCGYINLLEQRFTINLINCSKYEVMNDKSVTVVIWSSRMLFSSEAEVCGKRWLFQKLNSVVNILFRRYEVKSWCLSAVHSLSARLHPQHNIPFCQPALANNPLPSVIPRAAPCPHAHWLYSLL